MPVCVRVCDAVAVREAVLLELADCVCVRVNDVVMEGVCEGVGACEDVCVPD